MIRFCLALVGNTAGNAELSPLYLNVGVGLGIGAMFLPMLSAFGPAPPLVAGAAMLSKFTVDKVHKAAEIRRARSSLLGVLASMPRRSS